MPRSSRALEAGGQLRGLERAAMSVITTTAAFVLSVGLVTRAAAGEVVLEVGDAILLELEQATLREALLEIGKAAAFSLSERGAAPEQLVSLRVEAQTWEGLFRKLLGRESHLVTLDAATGTPIRLVVRWDAVREAQDAETRPGPRAPATSKPASAGLPVRSWRHPMPPARRSRGWRMPTMPSTPRAVRRTRPWPGKPTSGRSPD
jgi:hypothetical protein